MKTLLFDYDGVILRSYVASKTISRRCTKFVADVVGVRNLHQAEVLNRGLYTSYGHTALGLRALGYDISIKDFNKQVYKNIDYNELGICEADFDIPQNTKNEPLYIFSSAPDEWIIGTLGAIGVSRNILDKICIIRSTDQELLKPDIKVFCDISSQYGGSEYILIDDSFLNISNAIQVKGWKGIWITHDKFKVNNDITTATGLQNICCSNAFLNNSKQFV